ncbi:MAG: DUF4286 family protein [Anaerolineae bacterium]|nr:DUF4286 family protein [Phycisphaerae bacterium]
MPQMIYTVTGTFDSAALADEWAAWLRDEQIAQMVACGAMRGEIARIDNPKFVVQVQYRFESRSALSLYQLNHGPRLRAAMLGRFSPGRGASFARATGTVELTAATTSSGC